MSTKGANTPGPWWAERGGQNHIWYVNGGGSYSICTLDHRGVQGDADARLIAAAPELLEALEALVERCNYDVHPVMMTAPYTLLRRQVSVARAAIARARGDK